MDKEGVETANSVRKEETLKVKPEIIRDLRVDDGDAERPGESRSKSDSKIEKGIDSLKGIRNNIQWRERVKKGGGHEKHAFRFSIV